MIAQCQGCGADILSYDIVWCTYQGHLSYDGYPFHPGCRPKGREVITMEKNQPTAPPPPEEPKHYNRAARRAIEAQRGQGKKGKDRNRATKRALVKG